MAKFRQVQSSFAYGMLSEEAAARTDLDFIKQGCSELTNFVVEPIGGIRKRRGFDLIKTLTLPQIDSSDVVIDAVKCIPIKGSSNYLLITKRAHDYYLTSFYYVLSILDENYNYLSDVTFFSGFDSTSYSSYLICAEVTSITQLGDIFICTFSNNYPSVIGPTLDDRNKYEAYDLMRWNSKLTTDVTSRKVMYQYYPFNEWNLDQNATLTASGLSGDVSLEYKKNSLSYPFFKPNTVNYIIAANYLDGSTWKKATWETEAIPIYIDLRFIYDGVNVGFWKENTGRYLGYVVSTLGTISVSNSTNPSLAVGKKVYTTLTAGKHTFAATWGGVIISPSVGDIIEIQVEKTSSVRVTTVIAPLNTNPTYSWALPEWNPMDGFPTKVSFVGTRFCLSGSPKDTEAIWLSAGDNILKFNNRRMKADETATASETGLFGAVGDLDAHKTRATSAQFNRTSWVLNADELTIGCQGGIFILNRSSTGDYLPNKTTSSAISYDSAADIEPTMMEFGIVFVDQTRKSLKFLDFRSEKKGVNDISLLVGGLFTNITQILYQRSTKTLWILDDGNLRSFTLSTFTNVAGFATHSFPDVVSIKHISMTSDDEVLLTVQKGTQPNVQIGVAILKQTSTYVDFYSSLTNATPITAWTTPSEKFKILGGQTVYCEVNGVASTGTFNADGSVFTAAIAGTSILIGYPYTARMVTVSLDPDGVLGSSVGAMKRPDEVVLKVKNTKGMKVGGKTLYDSKQTTTIFSGDVVEKVAADPSLTSKITVESTGNNHCHILGITYKGLTQE